MKPKLKKCLGIWVIIIGLTVGGSGLWLLLRPQEYQATARVQVKYAPNPEVFSDPFFTECEFQVIASRVMLGRAAEALNLNVEWGGKYAGGKTLKTPETVQLLKQRLHLRVPRDTEIIEISVNDEDPIEAARIANSIAGTYCDYAKEESRQLLRGETIRLKEAFQQEDSLKNAGPPSRYGIFVTIVDLAVPPASPIGPGRLLVAVMLLCGLAALVPGFYLLSRGGISTNHER